MHFDHIFLHAPLSPPDKPSKPGKPRVTDHDEKSVELEWAAPETDGGAKITHYIVQKRSLKSDSWEKVAVHETPTGDEPLRCKVTEGLKLKDRVVFRVIAVNKAGESPPSDPSDTHTVWYKKRKYIPPDSLVLATPIT